jgi:uncharacterized protein YdhG (YjbR/CyaY superfamily)
MAKPGFRTVAEYIAAQPRDVQPILRRVRAAIRRALPRAKEGISYQIPTYKIDERAVLYFAGWRQHYSLYPATAALVAAFEDDLASYEVRKGTIRFPLKAAVPIGLIARIARFRAKKTAARAISKPARRRR